MKTTDKKACKLAFIVSLLPPSANLGGRLPLLSAPETRGLTNFTSILMSINRHSGSAMATGWIGQSHSAIAGGSPLRGGLSNSLSIDLS